jgi:type II secretion system protein N
MAEAAPGSLIKIVRISCYAAIASAVFLSFLIADFPYGDVLSAFLAPSGVAVEYKDQRLSLPFGARLEQVRIHYPDPSGAAAVIESPQMTLSPTIGALLLGRPGLRLHADLFDGSLRATVSRNGPTIDLTFTLDGLDLSGLQAARPYADGRVSGEGSIDLDPADALDGRGSIHFSGTRLTLRIMPGVAPLRFDRASGTLQMKSGIVELQSLEGHGEDLSIAAHGTIRLARSLKDCTVDLLVNLNPTPAGARRYAMLLGFLPHPPNSRAYVVHGPLTLPSVS